MIILIAFPPRLIPHDLPSHPFVDPMIPEPEFASWGGGKISSAPEIEGGIGGGSLAFFRPRDRPSPPPPSSHQTGGPRVCVAAPSWTPPLRPFARVTGCL